MLGERVGVDFDSVDQATLIKGMTDALNNKKLDLTHEEMATLIQEAQARKMSELKKKTEELAQKNLSEEATFLKKNKLKPDIKNYKYWLTIQDHT